MSDRKGEPLSIPNFLELREGLFVRPEAITQVSRNEYGITVYLGAEYRTFEGEEVEKCEKALTHL